MISKYARYTSLSLTLLAGCGGAGEPTVAPQSPAAVAAPAASAAAPAAEESSEREGVSKPHVIAPGELPPRSSLAVVHGDAQPERAVTSDEPQPEGLIPIPIPRPNPVLCLTNATNTINAKGAALAGALGAPTGDVVTIGSCSGYLRNYSNGTVYFQSGASDAYAVYGEIGAKYSAEGQEFSNLGYPVTDETGTPDGVGRFNHFADDASIYWKPNLGPHPIWGPIRDRWASEGWERNPNLGYPIADPIALPGGDSMVSFENGVLLLKSGATSACELFTEPGVLGSMAAADVENEIVSIIKQQMGSSAELQSINFFQMTDYIRDGWGAQNRRYDISVHNKYDNGIPIIPDPTGDLELQLEVRFNRSNTNVEYVLRYWHSYVSGIGNGTANDKIAATLNPLLDVPQVLKANVGTIVNEVKPMSNGDLNVYITPFTCS